MRLYFWLNNLLYGIRECFISNEILIINEDDKWDMSISSFGDFDSINLIDDYIDFEINPATGLPMMGCFDMSGNPYGFDMSVGHSLFDDGFSCDYLSITNSIFDEW